MKDTGYSEELENLMEPGGRCRAGHFREGLESTGQIQE